MMRFPDAEEGRARGDDIMLECENCRRCQPYARSIDPGIPTVVATIRHARCDLCDNGDFGQETWYDAADNEVSQGCQPATA